MNEVEKNKIRGFVDHLLNLPNIKNEQLLVAEGLILNFISANVNQLKTTFKTPQFFPNLEWSNVFQELLSNLYERVCANVLGVFNEFIDGTEFTALNREGNLNFPAAFQKEKLSSFLQNLFKNREARFNFSSVYNIFQFEIIEKYIGEIFSRREVIYNELVRVQKTHLECDDYIVFLKTLLLVKNAGFLKIPLAGDASNPVNLAESAKTPGKMHKLIDSLAANVRQGLPVLSDKAIKLALKSNLRESLSDIQAASSRLLYILSMRFHNYKPVEVIDRGAESPDKSWFAIVRKNAESYGFDKKMLEELYRIAGDNSW